MSFTELLQQKILIRRRGGSTVRNTEELLRQQAFDRIRPIHEAAAEMVERLRRDAVFSAGFGPDAKLVFQWDAFAPNDSSLVVDGIVGSFLIRTIQIDGFLATSSRIHLLLHITPEWNVAEALGCGTRYAEATPVEGDGNDVSGFLVAAEDMLAEFLADVFVSPAAGKYLPGAG